MECTQNLHLIVFRQIGKLGLGASQLDEDHEKEKFYRKFHISKIAKSTSKRNVSLSGS